MSTKRSYIFNLTLDTRRTVISPSQTPIRIPSLPPSPRHQMKYFLEKRRVLQNVYYWRRAFLTRRVRPNENKSEKPKKLCSWVVHELGQKMKYATGRQSGFVRN